MNTKKIRISFRTVTSPTDNPKMFVGHYVDYDTTARTYADAVKQIFSQAFYSHTINPYCIVFYDVQFGYIYAKEG